MAINTCSTENIGEVPFVRYIVSPHSSSLANIPCTIQVESIETGEQNNIKRFAFELARKFITTHKVASVKPGKTQYPNSKSDGGCFKIIFVPNNSDALDWMMAFK